jgi:hypothetical protein
MAWRERIELLPMKVRFVIIYAIFVTFVLIGAEHDERSIIGTAVGALFVTAVVMGVVALNHRRDLRIAGAEDKDDWITVVRALCTGDAPANTSFDKGLQVLAAKRRTDIRRLPWLFTAITSLVLVVTIASPDAGLILATCLSGLVSVLTWTDRVRDSRRLDRLVEALRSRQDAGSL